MNQNVYNRYPVFLLKAPGIIYGKQSYFLYHELLRPYNFRSSYDKELNLNCGYKDNVELKCTGGDNRYNRINRTFDFIDFSEEKIVSAKGKLREAKRKHKRWTREEDELLLELKKNEVLNWKKIAEYFPERTLKACQFRFSRLKCNKNIKRK